MALHLVAGGVASWLLKTFGLDLLVVVKDALESQWRRVFAARNILILGSHQTGKSSLATFLRRGQPYEIVDGEIRPPDPTAAAVIVDRRFAAQKGNWLRIKMDLPGEVDLRSTWTAAIREVRPAGIIYMLDGRAEATALARAMDEAFEYVLSHYATGTHELIALHFFVNHADVWASTPARERDLIAQVTDLFEERRRGRRELETLRFAASATQLSPNRRAWPEVTRALHRFGADLME